MTKEKEKTDALEELKAHQKLVHDQREANAEMVRATIRAQEATELAEEARKRAEESEREHRAVAEFREMFIGILGHDLRNPLSAIFMTAGQLLESSHLDEEEKRFTFAGGHNRSWESIRSELDRCVLLCQNCHAEVHAGVRACPMNMTGEPGSQTSAR